MVKRIYIPPALIGKNKDNNRHWRELADFLDRKMDLDVVTLAVHETLGAIEEQRRNEHGINFKDFGHGLHEAMLEIFQAGQLRQLRFVHPHISEEAGSGYDDSVLIDHTVSFYIEPSLFPARTAALQTALLASADTGLFDQVEELHEQERNRMWARSDYRVEIAKSDDVARGTTVCLQRMIGPKRPSPPPDPPSSHEDCAMSSPIYDDLAYEDESECDVHDYSSSELDETSDED